MNSAFVGYEELRGSRKGVIHFGLRPRCIEGILLQMARHIMTVDNTILDPLNSSYPTKAEFITC